MSLLRPSRLNSLIRYYTFLVTRLLGFALGINLVLKVESTTMASAFWCLVAGLMVDNARTLRAFRRAALGMQREDSFVTGPYTDHDPQRRPSSPRSTCRTRRRSCTSWTRIWCPPNPHPNPSP